MEKSMKEVEVIRMAKDEEGVIKLVFGIDNKYCDSSVADVLHEKIGIPKNVAKRLVKETLNRITEEFKEDNRVKVFQYQFVIWVKKDVDGKEIDGRELKELIKRVTNIAGQEIFRMIKKARKIREKQDITSWLYEFAKIDIKDDKVIVKQIL